MDFTWIAEEQTLTSAALTVRAQAISPNDEGRLLWDAFFPRVDVDSIKLDEILTLDFRPVADRREWNARGRLVTTPTPQMREMEIVPIESYFNVGEREIQALVERNLNANREVYRRIIGASIPARVDSLVSADYRRIEIDAMTAWALGTITQRNPQTGATFAASFGFSSGRYQTAGTAWSNSGLNAYEEFLAWLEDGVDAVGSVSGAVMRLATFKAIQADAPQGIQALRLTRAGVQERLSDELGTPFTFYIVEESHDIYTSGGTEVSRTKAWPANRIALVPDGEVVGSTAFAPVARAAEADTNAPDAGIDVRGVTVYREVSGGGRQLTVEAQVNAMPIPDEQRCWVINAGV